MYEADNNGSLAPNCAGTQAGKDSNHLAWVAGWLDFTSSQDNTNTAMLIDHQTYPYGAYLGPYVGKNATLFKCPADHSTALGGGVARPRARSISMNCFLVAGLSSTGTKYGKFAFNKMPQILSPATTFVTLDEHAGCIDDGYFATDPGVLYQIVSYPAGYHDNACCFSFADGHTEIHKWLDPWTCPVFQEGQYLTPNVNLSGDKDVLWLAGHSVGLPQYPLQ